LPCADRRELGPRELGQGIVGGFLLFEPSQQQALELPHLLARRLTTWHYSTIRKSSANTTNTTNRPRRVLFSEDEAGNKRDDGRVLARDIYQEAQGPVEPPTLSPREQLSAMCVLGLEATPRRPERLKDKEARIKPRILSTTEVAEPKDQGQALEAFTPACGRGWDFDGAEFPVIDVACFWLFDHHVEDTTYVVQGDGVNSFVCSTSRDDRRVNVAALHSKKEILLATIVVRQRTPCGLRRRQSSWRTRVA